MSSNSEFPAEIITVGGKYFQYFDPDSIDGMDILTIAHALGNTCRFSGHVYEFYSVAEHCVHVSHLCPSVPFTGLMHDVSEAYLTDVPSPIKRSIKGFKEWEHSITQRLARYYGFQYPFPPEVKKADSIMLVTEGRDYTPAGRNGAWMQWADTVNAWAIPEPLGRPLPPGEAADLFLFRYYELTGDLPAYVGGTCNEPI